MANGNRNVITQPGVWARDKRRILYLLFRVYDFSDHVDAGIRQNLTTIFIDLFADFAQYNYYNLYDRNNQCLQSGHQNADWKAIDRPNMWNNTTWNATELGDFANARGRIAQSAAKHGIQLTYKANPAQRYLPLMPGHANHVAMNVAATQANVPPTAPAQLPAATTSAQPSLQSAATTSTPSTALGSNAMMQQATPTNPSGAVPQTSHARPGLRSSSRGQTVTDGVNYSMEVNERRNDDAAMRDAQDTSVNVDQTGTSNVVSTHTNGFASNSKGKAAQTSSQSTHLSAPNRVAQTHSGQPTKLQDVKQAMFPLLMVHHRDLRTLDGKLRLSEDGFQIVPKQDPIYQYGGVVVMVAPPTQQAGPFMVCDLIKCNKCHKKKARNDLESPSSGLPFIHQHECFSDEESNRLYFAPDPACTYAPPIAGQQMSPRKVVMDSPTGARCYDAMVCDATTCNHCLEREAAGYER